MGGDAFISVLPVAVVQLQVLCFVFIIHFIEKIVVLSSFLCVVFVPYV